MPYTDYYGNCREYKEEKEARKAREKIAQSKRHIEHGKKFSSMPLKEWCRIEREICYKRDLKYWVRQALPEFKYSYDRYGAHWGPTYTLKTCKPFNRTWIKRGLKNAFDGENGPGRLVTYIEGDPDKMAAMDPVFRYLCMIQCDLINEALIKDEEK